MEITLKNDNSMTVKLNFMDNSLEIESSYILEDRPSDYKKHGMKWKKLKDGKYEASGMVLIPIKFIAGLFSTNDEKLKKDLTDWIENGFKKLSEKKDKEQ